MTATEAALSQEAPTHATRSTLPMWRVQGTFTLTTPLSIGTGQDEPLHDTDQDSWVGCIARDQRGAPYLSGSGIKGALRALARRTDLPADILDRLFGCVQGNQTTPAQLEICNAYLLTAKSAPDSHLPGSDATRHSDLLMHSVRNRDYGTVEDGLLFTEQAVPAGCQFAFECSAQGLQESDIAHLLGLLQLAGDAYNSFQLGGRQSSDNGRVTWQLRQVNRLNDLRALWSAVKSQANAPIDLWASAASPHVHAKVLTQNSGELLLLPDLALKFHTPFLVYQANKAKQNVGDPDGVPRRNSAGQPVLPASSLHGALRSQAERILRTLGEETPAGYKVPAVFGLDNVARLDLASVLFGASGWRAVVQCSDFVAPKDAPLLKHDMVAIDRITGGGKDSAKFCIQALDCPTLTGSIHLDLGRLRKLESHNPQLMAQALGLLTHVLRDLDEGDLALGYGKAKGYGQCNASTFRALSKALADYADIDPEQPNLVQVCAAWNKMHSTQPARLPTPPTQDPADITGPKPLTPIAAAGDFHNPYAFLPFPNPKPKDDHLPWAGLASISQQKNHHSHAVYAAQALSGRVLCKLHTQTPIFIGAGSDPNQPEGEHPKRKLNFHLDGQVALPATSLRGMISSLHETISASAMRVMDNKTYSVRQDTGEDKINAFSSSAIGQMQIGKDGILGVVPLTLPTLKEQDNYELPSAFKNCFPPDDDGRTWVFGKVLLEPTKMRPPRGGEYEAAKRAGFQTQAAQNYWYVPLEPLLLNKNLRRDSNHFRDKNGFAIGQKPLPDGEYPLSEAEHTRLQKTNPESAANYVRGWLRVMHHDKRQLPPKSVRKYELFVPYPIELDDYDPFTLHCTESCLERFSQLSRERFDSQANGRPDEAVLQLPYSPINAERAAGQPLQPRPGDLVFFKPTPDGDKIAEISYSSIWRARLETNSQSNQPKAYQTLDGLPFAGIATLQPTDKRNIFSPSELLFGFVKDKKDAHEEHASHQQHEASALAFASKLRIGYGVATLPVVLGERVTLKILASPKPPSASMYFQKKADANGKYISKSDLTSRTEQYVFQGRKAYLHALRKGSQVQSVNAQGKPGDDKDAMPPWQTRHPADDVKQKVCVTPIAKDQTFYFEIDFDNLTYAELQALCAALVPTPAFEHKLGMGKPIGLGSVKIEPLGVYIIDRATRYKQDAVTSTPPRYHQGWQSPNLAASQLPPHLASTVQDVGFGNDIFNPMHMAQHHMARFANSEPAAYRAVALTGNPLAVNKPVHYPQLAGRAIEGENFEWFVNNAKPINSYDGTPQQLKHFTAESTGLPTLSQTERKRKPR